MDTVDRNLVYEDGGDRSENTMTEELDFSFELFLDICIIFVVCLMCELYFGNVHDH